MNRRVPAAALAGCLAAVAAGARPDTAIVTRDGRRFTGQADLRGQLVRITAGDREVFLTRGDIARVVDVAPPAGGAPPVYTFNREPAARDKAGFVSLHAGFPRLSNPGPGGVLDVALRDPELGSLAFRAVVTELTPRVCTLEGVEYGWAYRVAPASLGAVVRGLVAEATPDDDPDALLKAARFHRLAGDPREAASWLERLAAVAPAHEALAGEREAVLGPMAEAAFARARRELARGKPAAALAELPSAAFVPAGLGPERERLLAEAQARQAAHDRVRAWSRRVPRGLTRIRAAEAERLDRVLRLGTAEERDAEPGHLPLLMAAWAEPLAAMTLDPERLDEAAALADATAAFFAAPLLPDPRPLAARYEASALRPQLLLAILRHAARYPEDPPKGWHRVDFAIPGREGPFHYYLKAPRDYRPDAAWPALVSLHGQFPMADRVAAGWGAMPDTEGFLLIGAEYIYGRASGYRFTGEEQEAVVEAVRHAAATYRIDPDRVFLHGVSQGGHAAWDIGSARAGCFAGVAPVSGVPLAPVDLSNFLDTTLYATCGRLDTAASQENRRAMAELANLSALARCVEYTARGHEAFGGEHPFLADWMRATRRPLRAELHLAALRASETRRRWMEIRGTRLPLRERPGRTAKPAILSASIRDNEVVLEGSGVTGVRVYLDPRLLDLDREVRFVAGGRLSLTRRPRRDWAFALEDSYRRRDRSDVFLGFADVAIMP